MTTPTPTEQRIALIATVAEAMLNPGPETPKTRFLIIALTPEGDAHSSGNLRIQEVGGFLSDYVMGIVAKGEKPRRRRAKGNPA